MTTTLELQPVNSSGEAVLIDGVTYSDCDSEDSGTFELCPTGLPSCATAIALAPPPAADFTADVLSGDAPLSVSFTDISAGSPHEWAWTFGDGGTSAEQNPTYTYDDAGVFTVTLTVTNYGGTDVETKTALISVGAGCAACADDFTGADYDPVSSDIWTPYDTDHYIFNNRCRFAGSTAYGVLSHNCLFTGVDLDVQIDIGLEYDSTSAYSLRKQIGFFAESGWFIIYAKWLLSSGRNYIITNTPDGDTTTDMGSTPFEFAQFRIVKSGATVRSYYRLSVSDSWTMHAETTMDEPDDDITVALYSHHQSVSGDIFTHFDNFVFNSGC